MKQKGNPLTTLVWGTIATFGDPVMVVTPSGRCITVRALRKCKKCGASTWHVCYGIRQKLRFRIYKANLVFRHERVS